MANPVAVVLGIFVVIVSAFLFPIILSVGGAGFEGIIMAIVPFVMGFALIGLGFKSNKDKI